jgi:hypothetical protein
MGIPPVGPLAYEGTIALPYILRPFDPPSSSSPSNQNFTVPFLWVNYESGQSWILTQNTATTALWVLNGSSVSTPGILSLNTTVLPNSGGNVNLQGSTNIAVTNSTNQIDLSFQGTLPNASLDNSTIGIVAGTGVVVSSSPVSLGGSTTVSVNNIPNSALQTIQNAALANSSISVVGGTGITVTGSPVSLGGSVTIASSAVTTTNPAFHAYLNASTAYSQGNPVPFDTTSVNVGAFYSTSAFSATAPVKGFYSFVVSIGITTSSLNFSITLNNTTTGAGYQTQNCGAANLRNDLGFFSTNASWLIPLNAGDVVNITIVNTPNPTLAGVQGTNEFTTFSGVLISTLP